MSVSRARNSSTSSISNSKRSSQNGSILADNHISTSLADSGVAEINGYQRSYSVSGAISPLPQGRMSSPETGFSILRSMGSRDRLEIFNGDEDKKRRQSCFESSTLPSNMKRSSQNPQLTLDLLNRQVTLEKREKELADATREALAKVEEAEKLFGRMETQEKELEEYRNENELLQNEVAIQQERIEELEMISAEQREQLSTMREKAANVESEADKMKVSHMALDNSSPYEDLLTKYHGVVSERDQLVKNCEEMREYLSQLRAQNASLKSSLSTMNKARQQEEEKVEESRDKTELLSVIREKINEKVQWERYACDLVYRIVTRDPAMLERTSSDRSGDGVNTEACWEAYAKALLSQVMNQAPHILHDLDQSYVENYSISECSLEIG